MKIQHLYIIFLSINLLSAQESSDSKTKNVFRVNFVNPSLEYELKTGNNAVISAGAGIGYGGSYRELELQGANGLVHIIAPFIDIQQKWFYNRNKRISNDKSVEYNSGNYISFRGISRFASIAENVTRTDDVDFAIGPTWGLQRSFNKIHFLFDIGPQYYFDSKGNNGFFPLMIQINVGFNLSSK